MPPDDENVGYQGLQSGFENVYYGARYGMNRMAGDLSQLGSTINPMSYQNQSQAQYQHHGMTMFEMNAPQAMAAASNLPFRQRTPYGTTEVEYRQMAAEQSGQSIAKAAVYGGFYLGTGALTTAAFLATPMGYYGKAGFRAGRMAVGALGSGAGYLNNRTFFNKWTYSLAKEGSIAARAGKFTEYLGMGRTAGITASTIGAGVAGAAMRLAAPIAIMSGVDQAVETVAEAAQERGEIQDYIQASSFRYAPIGSSQNEMFGGGFGRRAAGRIAESMQNYESKQTFYDMGDLKSILQKGTQIGLFSGTKDAEDFQKKFKETSETLKNVTKILHTTLSEGLDTIKALRDIGLTDPKLQMAAVNRADVIGLASGKTAGEMFTIGLQGAQVFRGTGVSMAAGAQSNQMIYAGIENAIRSGAITEEQIAHMGGREAAAQSMSTQTMRFAQSPIGRGLMMAVAPTGELNQDAFNRFASGQDSIYKTLNNASRAMMDPLSFMKFQTNQEKIMGDIMGQAGGLGAMLMPTMGAFNIAREQMKTYRIPQTAENLQQTMKFVMRTQMGMSAEESDLTLKTMSDPEQLQRTLTAGLYQNNVKNVREAVLEETSWGNRFQRWWKSSKRPLRQTGQAVGRAIDDISVSTTEWYNEEILGISPAANLTIGAEARTAASGMYDVNGNLRADIQNTSAVATLRNRVANGDVGGAINKARAGYRDIGGGYYLPEATVRRETGFGTDDIVKEKLLATEGGTIAQAMRVLNPSGVSNDKQAGWTNVVERTAATAGFDALGKSAVNLAVYGKLSLDNFSTASVNPAQVDATFEMAKQVKLTGADIANPLSSSTLDTINKSKALRKVAASTQGSNVSEGELIRNMLTAVGVEEAVNYLNPEQAQKFNEISKAGGDTAGFLGSRNLRNLNAKGQQVLYGIAQTSSEAARTSIESKITASEKLALVKSNALGAIQLEYTNEKASTSGELSWLLRGAVSETIAADLAENPAIQTITEKIAYGDYTNIEDIGLELNQAIINATPASERSSLDSTKLKGIAGSLRGDSRLATSYRKNVSHLKSTKARITDAASRMIDDSMKAGVLAASSTIIDPSKQAEFNNKFKSISDMELLNSRVAKGDLKGLREDFQTTQTLLKEGSSELRETASPVMRSIERGLNVLETYDDKNIAKSNRMIADTGMLQSYQALTGLDTKTATAAFENKATRAQATMETIKYEEQKLAEPKAIAEAAAKGGGGQYLPEVAKALQTIGEQTRSIAMAFQALNVYAAALKNFTPGVK